MASIFTGLAFMHGHIVDRELIQRLGREEPRVERGEGVDARKAKPKAARKPLWKPRQAACASSACC